MTRIKENILNEGRQAHTDATLVFFGATLSMSVGREAQRRMDELLRTMIGPLPQATYILNDFLDERKK